MRLWHMPMLALLLAACGGDATGPANLTGTWQYTALGLSKADTACNVLDLTLSLTRSGSAISGKTSGGRVQCSRIDVPENLPANMTVFGTVDGNAVTLDIATSGWHHTGVMSGNSIAGTASFKVREIATGATILTGAFTLVKK